MDLFMFKVERSFLFQRVLTCSILTGGEKTCPGVGNTLKGGASLKGKKLQKGPVHMFNRLPLSIPAVSQGAFRPLTAQWDC